tara:strand:- start:627 stop:1061 length:435 start_codon:yes stop_codon:yes gene_type:complete
MDPVNSASLELTEYLVPWIALLISLVVTMWIKDWVTAFVKGMQFRRNPAFQEGDHVILDGTPSVIVKIGIQETVFGVYSDAGYTWRYVPNVRIPFLKLEKIVNPELHLDSPREKAQKIQELIDAGQDDRISKNKDAIEQLKNGK